MSKLLQDEHVTMKKKVKCQILILTLHTRQVNTSAAFAAVFWSWPLAFFISACFLAFFCWDWIFWCPRAIVAKPEVTHGGKMSSCFPILNQGLCGNQCLIHIYHKQVLLSLTGAQRLSNGTLLPCQRLAACGEDFCKAKARTYKQAELSEAWNLQLPVSTGQAK